MIDPAGRKTHRTKSPTPARGADAATASDLPEKLEQSQARAEPSLSDSSDTLTLSSGEASIQTAAPDMSQMIAECAYFRAQRRGFSPGYEMEDWIAAEIELKARLDESDKQSSAGVGG